MKTTITIQRLIFFFLLCFSSLNLSAQMSELVTKEDSYESEINHVLSPLDFKEVTTGLLKDKALNLIPFHLFENQLHPNNWIDINRYGKIYATLYGATIDPKIKLPDPGPAYMDVCRADQIDTIIPMTILLYDYHQFREDAVKTNLLDTLNGQLHDVSGRAESPYEKKSILAMAPIQTEAPSLELSFQFPANLFHSNIAAELDYLEIDFDNGRGYQSVDLNKDVYIAYSQAGSKDIKIKAALLDGRILQCHSLLEVKEKLTKDYDFFNPETPEIIDPSSEHAGAVMTIVLSCPEEGLRKPLIVVEGWDPPQTDNTGYLNELRDWNFSPYPGNSAHMDDLLDEAGYDLVFVDYNYGSDHISRNAKVVQDAIRRINTMLEANGSPEPITMIGLSMGGITSRIALLNMESAGEDHNTDLLISMDSPLTGANVPYGLQHMVKHIADLNIGLILGFRRFRSCS